jgi:hypothetical protein
LILPIVMKISRCRLTSFYNRNTLSFIASFGANMYRHSTLQLGSTAKKGMQARTLNPRVRAAGGFGPTGEFSFPLGDACNLKGCVRGRARDRQQPALLSFCALKVFCWILCLHRSAFRFVERSEKSVSRLISHLQAWL